MRTGKPSSSGKLSSRAEQSRGLQVLHRQRKRPGAIKRRHTCADTYSMIDSEVTVVQAVSVGQVVDVIAEMAWS